MQMLRHKKLIAGILGLSVLTLTGCQSVNPYTGQTEASNTAKGGVIGTIGGAAIGAIAGGGRGALIGGAIGGLTGTLVGSTFDKQNEELRRTLVGTGVQVENTGNSIQLIMASDVTFKTDQADVRSSFYPTLNSVAIVLNKYRDTSITITGFTDNVGGAAYNQDLSEKRAQSVGDYLVSQGISPNRISTQGRGLRNPIASNATAQGRALNRRVEITLRPIS